MGAAMKMSYTRAIAIIALLFIGGAVAPRQRKNASEHSPIPEKMIVRVGGWVYYPRDGGKPEPMHRGAVYSVELRGKNLHYSVIKSGSDLNVEKVITPTREQWEAFWKEAENARLWSWSDKYYNYNVHDGTHWLVEISYQGRSIKSSGANSYPSEDAVSKPSPSPEYSRPFITLLQGVRNLLGGLEFE
jgi:hypothetical protein